MPEEKEKPTLDQEQTTDTQPVAPPKEEDIRKALVDGTDEDYSGEYITEETPSEKPTPQEPPTEETPTEGPPTEETPPADQEPKTTDYKPSPVWDRIKSDWEKQMGEDTFKMPEGITPETEYDVLYEFLAKNVEPDLEGYPPEAKEIITLHKQGKYDPEKYFKERSPEHDITKLSDKDFLVSALRAENGKSEKNPEGWTDEDIDEFLSDKSKIELHNLAKTRREQVLKSREEQTKQYQQAQVQRLRETVQKEQASREKQAKEIVNQFKESRDFFGIEFSPEDKAQYDKDFFEMVKLNPETGTHKFNELLQNNEMLYKIGAILWKGEGLRGYISDIKEKVKTNVEEKLDPTLEQQKGSTKISKAVDRGKLF